MGWDKKSLTLLWRWIFGQMAQGGFMKKGTILVVDDDEAMLTMLGEFLSSLGYVALEFRSAEAALEKFQTMGADSILAVISDVNMPNMDGLEFLKLIKSQTQPRPVILISAFGSTELEKKALQGGAAGFVNKPFALQRLKSTLETILAS